MNGFGMVPTRGRPAAATVLALLWLALILIGVAGGEPARAADDLPARTAGGHPDDAWSVPAFHLPDPKGDRHSLADWKGKVIVLNFWATWCLPCQVEIRQLNGWQKEFGAAGLQVVGIGLDDPRRVRNFARSFDIGYPVLAADAAGPALMADWGNGEGVVPFTVVIDRDGRVPYVERGQFSEAAFERYVRPLLDTGR